MSADTEKQIVALLESLATTSDLAAALEAASDAVAVVRGAHGVAVDDVVKRGAQTFVETAAPHVRQRVRLSTLRSRLLQETDARGRAAIDAGRGESVAT